MSGDGEPGFNVEGNRVYGWHQRQLPIWKHAGRPPGHAVTRGEVIQKLNAAVREHDGPRYKWWAASVLGVSVPTLRALLSDYGLQWPPPWC